MSPSITAASSINGSSENEVIASLPAFDPALRECHESAR
jgi:hypothetical protein